MKSSRQCRSGFSLIEVTLALGVVSFCMVPLFALLPLGMTTSQNASQQAAATEMATAISADLQASPVIGGTSSRFGIPFPSVSSTSSTSTLFFAQDGSVVAGSTAGAGSRYRATLTISKDASDTTLLKVWIFVTWPALADPSSTAPPQNFSGSYETATTLNCF
jgi:uncharacterized protein (TIGR02598 family)